TTPGRSTARRRPQPELGRTLAEVAPAPPGGPPADADAAGRPWGEHGRRHHHLGPPVAAAPAGRARPGRGTPACRRGPAGTGRAGLPPGSGVDRPGPVPGRAAPPAGRGTPARR